MAIFTEITDEDGKIIGLKTPLRGMQLASNPELNKGSAFTREEREEFKLLGKLPYHVEKIENQVSRYYKQYQLKNSDLGKNKYLNELKQNNLTLFYRLVSHHLEEMLPIIYTPTIGDAVQAYSYQFNKPSGLQITYPDKDKMETILDNRVHRELDLIIVTDGEGVLGIGDWGVGGMDICIGKLMVYTLCGGINPRRTLPIQLDVGTNNHTLLNDPMYLGWRHERISSDKYEEFVQQFVTTIQKKFPHVFLHWEDLGRDNARKILLEYRDQMCTFNDDMQGTGATALATMISGLNATDQELKDQRIVFFGAGTAGVGIADQIKNAMVHKGLSEEEACKRIWLIDRPGLLTDDMPDLAFFQKPYARSKEEVKDWKCQSENQIGLLDVINNIKPTVLIGCSTVQGAFNRDIVTKMAEYVGHPLIFPLSNPTSKSEAVPADIIEWTKGKALVATGSPFTPVHYENKTIKIAQCNNAFIFPGLGLGIIAAKATRVTDSMLAAAALSLGENSPAIKDKTAPLLPDIDDVQTISRKIAYSVAKQAIKEDVARIKKDVDLEKRIEALFWKPEYLSYTLEK